jgi:cytochrome c553
MRVVLLISALVLVPAAHADQQLTRTLAASCAACHGTDGNSIGGMPVLAGLERNHFVLQMQSFRNGARASTVMHHHAKGLTLEEIEVLADYFSQQPRRPAGAPMSMKHFE